MFSTPYLSYFYKIILFRHNANESFFLKRWSRRFSIWYHFSAGNATHHLRPAPHCLNNLNYLESSL